MYKRLSAGNIYTNEIILALIEGSPSGGPPSLVFGKGAVGVGCGVVISLQFVLKMNEY